MRSQSCVQNQARHFLLSPYTPAQPASPPHTLPVPRNCYLLWEAFFSLFTVPETRQHPSLHSQAAECSPQCTDCTVLSCFLNVSPVDWGIFQGRDSLIHLQAEKPQTHTLETLLLHPHGAGVGGTLPHKLLNDEAIVTERGTISQTSFYYFVLHIEPKNYKNISRI